MKSVSELSHTLGELRELTSLCTRCGMCQSVCPVFKETGKESDFARGKLALVDGIMDEVLHRPERALERINRCLLCGKCSRVCPRGVSSAEIFIKARGMISSFCGIPLFKRFLLAKIIADPRVFSSTAILLATAQKFFPTKTVDEVASGSRIMLTPPFSGGRHVVPLSKDAFVSGTDYKKQANGHCGAFSGSVKAAFFTGCVIDKVFPHVARSSVEALSKNGVELFLPDGEACCGIPALAAGDYKTFSKLVEHNVTLFDEGDFDFIVTACATCAYTIKLLWPLMYRGEKRGEFTGKVREAADKVMDISQFIARKTPFKGGSRQVSENSGKQGESSQVLSVAYHDPCHLKGSLGVFSEPRELIKSTTGYRLKEMKSPDSCCGGGGSFSLENYSISSAIGNRKSGNIVQSGADVIATSCPGCMLQLSDMLSKRGHNAQVRHVIEIYNMSL